MSQLRLGLAFGPSLRHVLRSVDGSLIDMIEAANHSVAGQ
jgi:hypothetical protein